MVSKDTTSEKKIEAYLQKEIKKLGGFCIKFLPFLLKGFPDRMCLLPEAKIYFIELKALGKTPKKAQVIWHKRLQKLGFNILVLDSKQKVKNFIEHVT